MAERPLLPRSRVSDTVAEQQARFHHDAVDEVRAAVDGEAVVVVGMAQNPHVRKARVGLDKAGIGFRYLEYGSYLNSWRKRLAIKLWAGYPTFPMVFVHGVFIGGNRELQQMLGSGELQQMIDAGRENDQAAA